MTDEQMRNICNALGAQKEILGIKGTITEINAGVPLVDGCRTLTITMILDDADRPVPHETP